MIEALTERPAMAEFYWATAARCVIALTNEFALMKRRLDEALAATPAERPRAN